MVHIPSLYKWLYRKEPPCPLMADYELREMSPWRKWQLFGKFPWKLLLDLSLFVAVLFIVVYRGEVFNSSSVNAKTMVSSFLYPPSSPP
jgi:hypothetical protein